MFGECALYSAVEAPNNMINESIACKHVACMVAWCSDMMATFVGNKAFKCNAFYPWHHIVGLTVL